MEDINTSKYEIKVSKTGLKIPVLDGVHLHSIYNPDKEAQTFVSGYADQLVNNNKVLILGLGFAYHVNAFEILARKIHGNNFKIVVIDPSTEVYNDCSQLGLISPTKNISIYTNENIDELYEDDFLINFPLSKPILAAHTASFNYYRKFFQNFLTFKPINTAQYLATKTKDPELKNFLDELDQVDVGHMIARNQTVATTNRCNNLIDILKEFSALTKEG